MGNIRALTIHSIRPDLPSCAIELHVTGMSRPTLCRYLAQLA